MTISNNYFESEFYLDGGVDLQDEPWNRDIQLEEYPSQESEREDWLQCEEIVFLDRRLEDLGTLLRGLRPHVELIFLNSQQDGVAQITQALETHFNLKALHFVVCGSPGTLYLGETELNLQNLDRYEAELRQWSRSLAEGAEILLYGGNVAQSFLFVSAIHELTRANIAASSTPVGATNRGGSWELDVRLEGDRVPHLPFGARQFEPARSPFSLEALAAWQGALSLANSSFWQQQQ